MPELSILYSFDATIERPDLFVFDRNHLNFLKNIKNIFLDWNLVLNNLFYFLYRLKVVYKFPERNFYYITFTIVTSFLSAFRIFLVFGWEVKLTKNLKKQDHTNERWINGWSIISNFLLLRYEWTIL